MASSESAELRKIISWSDYDELVSSIASQLGDWEPDAIVGLTRGGLVPAVSLSHRYNAKLYCLNISLRDGKASSAGFDWRRLEKYENILIVDDINDSGATLWEVANQIYGRMIAKPKFATLVSKETSEFDNLIFGDKINKTEEDDWVVFPWE